MIAAQLSYPLAALAGLVSFLSPCVFPLVPAYVAFLSGRAGQDALPGASIEDADIATARAPAGMRRAPLLANGVAFVCGFSVIFILAYYILRAIDQTLLQQHQSTVNLVAGVIVVILALNTLGVIHIPALMREQRPHLQPRKSGMVQSFVLGLTFAAGWTPCIGPQLTAILAVAQDGRFEGLPVMLAYCFGLAIPFLIVAGLTDRLQRPIRAANRHLGVVNLVAGAVLLAFGVLLITDRLTLLSRFSAQSPFNL
jgi:cytochrome c-type biogenesis protein